MAAKKRKKCLMCKKIILNRLPSASYCKDCANLRRQIQLKKFREVLKCKRRI